MTANNASFNEEKNSGGGAELSPRPAQERCVLCKHSRHFFDEERKRCAHAWADFPTCNCQCVFTTANPDALIRAAPALYEAVMALLPYLSDRTQLLDYASLNEGRASGFDIASVKAREALALVNAQDASELRG